MNTLARLWTGRCTAYAQGEKTTNTATGRTERADKTLFADKPCRISFKSTIPAQSNGDISTAVQSIKLFIGRDVEIPPGSKIEVTQNGITGTYSRSGEPATYTNHQEIALDLFKEWA